MKTTYPTQLPARQCRARARSGLRCKRAPIPGGTVCRMHGGAAPQVRQAAAMRIAALVHPALDCLQAALSSQDIGAAVRAARDLLDRAGYAASRHLDISGMDGPPVVAICRVIVDPADQAGEAPAGG